jgi:flagellar hook-associated protein 2
MPLSSTNTTGFGIVLMSPDSPSGESGEGKGVTGLDVAGTINGEPAIGTGQVLASDTASTTSAIKGFSVLTTTTSPLTTHVRFTKGIGAAMQDFVTKLTSTTGTFATAQSSLNDQIKATTTSIAEMETKLIAQQDRLADQYAKMESALAKLQNQSSALSSLNTNNSK